MIYNIRVPTVYPGLVQTGLFENTPSVNTTGKKKNLTYIWNVLVKVGPYSITGLYRICYTVEENEYGVQQSA